VGICLDLKIKRRCAMYKPEFLTRKAVSRDLGISESTVIRWVKIKRLIPPFKLGPNRTVWSRDALELWKKSRKNDIPDWAK
jgi:predicted DNA-binding transcriptional regulator AlpA